MIPARFQATIDEVRPLADAFVALPGGLGTLDELKQASAVQGPLEDIFLRLTGREAL